MESSATFSVRRYSYSADDSNFIVFLCLALLKRKYFDSFFPSLVSHLFWMRTVKSINLFCNRLLNFQSGKLSWIDLENLIHGLDKVKLFLNEQMNKEAHEGHQTKQIESSRDQTAATSTVNFLRIFFVFSSLSRYLTKSMMGHRNGALLH